MRILLTNDDGVEAEGLDCLERIARTLSDDIWVCAPQVEQSGKGRGITLTEPLRVNRLGEKRFAVTGTPTDCVVLAVNDLMPERPDLVLSGVNRGANTGHAVLHSGTVGATLSGSAHGIRGLAVSIAYHDPRHWETAAAFARPVLDWVVAREPDGVLNLNVPDLPVEQVRGLRKAPLASFGAVQARIHEIEHGNLRPCRRRLGSRQHRGPNVWPDLVQTDAPREVVFPHG